MVSVAAPDQAGILAQVARLVAMEDVNMLGFILDASGIHLLVRDHETVLKALRLGDLDGTARAVREVVLEDRAGSLAELCERLGAAGIEIVTAFGVVAAGAGRMFIAVSDWPRAEPILQAHARREEPSPPPTSWVRRLFGKASL